MDKEKFKKDMVTRYKKFSKIAKDCKASNEIRNYRYYDAKAQAIEKILKDLEHGYWE